MIISCIQMDVRFKKPDENYANARRLIESAASANPDVILLPETWNSGFFPKENLASYCDMDGKRTEEEIGGLAREYGINIIAGSVSDLRDSGVYNTSYVFDRKGRTLASYDKTHPFSPSGENDYYKEGQSLCRFTLDGVSCGILICYEVRFPELCRTLALGGVDVMFLPSQWPAVRLDHLSLLRRARAVENQMFLASCNAVCSENSAFSGGGSEIIDPLGNSLALAAGDEGVITAQCDLRIIEKVRSAIPVFRDRRRELYTV